MSSGSSCFVLLTQTPRTVSDYTFLLVPKGRPHRGVPVCALSHVRLFMTALAVALLAALSMEFSRQE